MFFSFGTPTYTAFHTGTICCSHLNIMDSFNLLNIPRAAVTWRRRLSSFPHGVVPKSQRGKGCWKQQAGMGTGGNRLGTSFASEGSVLKLFKVSVRGERKPF